jgi:septin-2A
MSIEHKIHANGGEIGGYLGFANLPNQVHRKSVKKGFEFTLMVVGESGLGKSTLINSLFYIQMYKNRKIPCVEQTLGNTIDIVSNTIDIEERGVKLKLTVVDTPGELICSILLSCFYLF